MTEARITIEVGDEKRGVVVDLAGFGSANREALSSSLGKKIVDSIWQAQDK